MARHPKYPNDTIQEAICEIKFAPVKEGGWNARTPGEIFKALGPDKFPGMEPINEIGLVFEFIDGQPRQAVQQGPTRYKFSNQDESRLVQVSPTTFAFNCVGKYPSWEVLQGEILQNWKVVSKFIAPQKIERVSLRYINRIPAPPADKISDWINPSDFIPVGIGSTGFDIKYRFENWYSRHDWIIVSLLRQIGAGGEAPVFLDIDRLRKIENILSEGELKQVVSELHEEIWTAFTAANGNKLRAHLEGKRE